MWLSFFIQNFFDDKGMNCPGTNRPRTNSPQTKSHIIFASQAENDFDEIVIVQRRLVGCVKCMHFTG